MRLCGEHLRLRCITLEQRRQIVLTSTDIEPGRLSMKHRVFSSIARRALCSASGSSCVTAGDPPLQHLRRAQAVELFRSNFLSGSHNGVSINVSDLDDMMRETRARPSLLLNGYGLLGTVLGSVSRVAPASCSATLSAIVNDVAEQSLNDSIRAMAMDGSTDAHSDIRETLKYHRDLRSSMGPSPSDAAAPSAPDGSQFSAMAEGARTVVSQALINAVKVADVV